MNAKVTTLSDLFGRRGGPKRPGSGQPGKGGFALAALIAILLASWFVLSTYYTVQPEERAVVKRLGEVIKIADPGLHFKLPFGVDSVELVATERVLKQEFGFRSVAGGGGERTQYSSQEFPDESLMLSGDLNMVDVEWVVQYRIADPMKYLYGMRDPTRALRDIAESVMRRVVGNRLGSDVLTTGRVEISNKARDEIQSAMERYDTGIQIVTVELQDVVPPQAVRPAFNEVNEARQERERMINEATKQANQVIPVAKGEANRTIAAAEGYATERVNGALGETARFRSILLEYRQAPEVTRTRMFLETIDQILPGIGAVVVSRDGHSSPLPLLKLRDAQAPAASKENAQ